MAGMQPSLDQMRAMPLRVLQLIVGDKGDTLAARRCAMHICRDIHAAAKCGKEITQLE